MMTARDDLRVQQTSALENLINLIGLAAFAVSGALLAVRRRFDIVGMAVLATITAIGGGVIRDVLIGAIPPAALRNVWWLAIPLLATVVVFFFQRPVRKLNRAVLFFDAIGLGVFCASGTAKAIAYGLGPLAAAAMGVVTGIGGGILRDLLAGDIPSVLRADSKLYAVPAVLGSGFVAAAHQVGWDGAWVQVIAAAGICGLRLLALWRGWGAPVARERFPLRIRTRRAPGPADRRAD
jgi:uncharacterized membrane protein YeiH